MFSYSDSPQVTCVLHLESGFCSLLIFQSPYWCPSSFFREEPGVRPRRRTSVKMKRSTSPLKDRVKRRAILHLPLQLRVLNRRASGAFRRRGECKGPPTECLLPIETRRLPRTRQRPRLLSPLIAKMRFNNCFQSQTEKPLAPRHWRVKISSRSC